MPESCSNKVWSTPYLIHTDVNRYPVVNPLRGYFSTRSNLTLTKIHHGQTCHVLLLNVGWVQPTTRSITHTDVNRYPVDSPLRYYPDDKLRATLRTRSNFTLTKVRYGQRLPRLDFIKARNGYKISSIGREQPTTLLFSMPTKIGIQEPSGFRVVARNGNYFVGCNDILPDASVGVSPL
jgi:hypothetical protein